MRQALPWMPVGLPLLLAATFLPLALGFVDRNPVYGYRTAKSLSSPELWREANLLAGGLGLGFSFAALLINLALLRVRRLRPEQRELACLGVVSTAMLICFGLAIGLNG